MANGTITIIVAAHKKYKMPLDPMYLPLQVGAEGRKDIGYQRDDEGDNISCLNPYLSELTGLYWAWKQLDSDYIGLTHYRRFFRGRPNKYRWESILKKSDIEHDLGKVKVFVPRKRRYYIETLYSHYAHTHYSHHLDEARRIIKEKYPDYVDSFDLAVKRRWGYMFNMMIMEKELLSEYCSWLFDILLELKNRLEEDRSNPYQARYCGRIGEIIFNVWITEQIRTGRIRKTEVKEIPVIHMEKINWGRKTTAFLLAKFAGKKYDESF